MTNAPKYYEPRKATPTEPITVRFADPTPIERWGEVIATAMGLLAIGFCLGLIVFALVAQP
jgi:hypothetical protein